MFKEACVPPKEWKSREVLVGDVGVGGSNPVRIQSMATSNTKDVNQTIDQIMKLADCGCEIARVTVQGKKEAESCEHIKNGLIKKGYTIPLVADIHFYPPAAMLVVDFVDKVRINPGNYLDRRALFKKYDYDEVSYQLEIAKIEEGFSPLIEKCIRLNKALRIGTNHGSLSDRIMSRFGDTPKGMVASAFEFARVCRKMNFHNFIFSMKASNPLVMIASYRLLVDEMLKLGWDYPLHLGVTEAGDGEDGRVKSSMGIGSLLLDGIGDTIRFSLTEDPWYEIDPCKRLLNFLDLHKIKPKISEVSYQKTDQKSLVQISKNFPLHRDGSVYVDIYEKDLLKDDFFDSLGFKMQLNQPAAQPSSVDALILNEPITDSRAMSKLKILQKLKVGIFSYDFREDFYPIYSLERACQEEIRKPYMLIISDEDVDKSKELLSLRPALILLELSSLRLEKSREFFQFLSKNDIKTAVLHSYKSQETYDDLVIRASCEIGSLLADQMGCGLLISHDKIPLKKRVLLSFNILQACRKRSSKTEFIACPGCGRTLFNLQQVTKKIREKTSHLPGVKIAIMGCIVNGPGEMADADFGYVGSRSGKVDLYVGKVCVEKNIDDTIAPEKLIDLIKKNGRWVEPLKEGVLAQK